MKDFTNLHQPTGRVITESGQDYLFFGGTAYLGLLVNEDYIDLYKQGLSIYGLNNGTSRNNNIQLGIFNQAEEVAAMRFGFEDAVMLSSGYLATQLAVKSLFSFGELLYAPHTHPALWYGTNPNVIGEMHVWMENIVKKINHSDEDTFVIVSNALDNMGPAYYDFSPLLQVDPRKKVILLIDDSHEIGVVRQNNVSIDLSIFDQSTIEVVVVASLAKGLGTDAGIILSSTKRITQFRKSPFYTGASPASPASLYAFIHSQEIYLAAFEKLQNNIQLFASLGGKSLNHIHHFPVFSSEEPELYQKLVQSGFLISSFPYPLETDPLLNRIVVTSLHVDDDLKKIAGIISAEIVKS
ncbi:8-amino-7-oxononanoate synthase [Sphingobacterium sp. ML3W]|uniref:aminotransferase class I/II-fold pyridoxal phosphate-dependent enzyme n=1 Tax=Sphingobacterium sp. ML3W TaxID=1538644 RepID=UPI0004F87975|nr:aminotransferase class I/II-fold pyridoxal phosphate-dependent enzyme [Sphingobacterium sp. ML3W]AIM35325.1 8-amino-7-oxononanoate synthase [Sphingobacterium sp. ML3W]